MPQGDRSPLGDLVHYHRRRLGLSREAVVDRSFALSGLIERTVSVRTIARIEQRGADRPYIPAMATVRALATVFQLEPGTPEYDAFIAAALPDSTPTSPTAPVEPAGARDPFAKPRFHAAGREEALARVTAAIDRAAGGRASLALVGASAGVGKTALVTAACHAALARHPNLAVLWTAALDRQGPPVPWEPFRTMLALMAGELDLASERELLAPANVEAITARLPAVAHALATVAAPVLGALLPVGALANPRMEAALDRDLRRQLDDALRRQVERPHAAEPLDTAIFQAVARYAAEGPLVLVVEDLHWAGPYTVDALSTLLARLAGRHLPVAVVASWRPDGLHAAHDSGPHPFERLLPHLSRRYPDARIDLGTAVGGARGRAFVDAVLAGRNVPDPESVAAALFERTAGVPLVVVNMLRLLEPAELTPEAIRALPLPEAITAIFAEQLQRLDAETRRLLQAASVQGGSFWAEPVMHALGIDEEHFVELVESRLMRRFAMIERRGEDHVAGRALHRYEFSHALLREHLATSLAAIERRRWHERTAEALIALLGAEDHAATDRIAVHLEAAGARARAAEAWLHAGVHALDQREIDRARAAFERVLALDTGSTGRSTALLARIGLGNCARAQADLPGARRLLEAALAEASAAALPVAQGHALEALAMVDFDAGEMQAGVDRLMTVIDLWTREEHEEAARAMANIGYLLYGMGRYEEAMTFARQSAARAEQTGETRVWISAEVARANCLMDLGLYDEAEALYRGCLPASRELRDRHRENLSVVNLGLAAIERGALDVAEPLVREVLDHSPSPLVAGAAQFYLGLIAERRGDIDTADAIYARCAEMRERHGQAALVIDALAGSLRVAVARGDRDAARALRGEIAGRISARGLDGIEHVARMYLAMADAAALLGESDRVEGALGDAVAFLRERAGRIGDLALREAYLERPPAHREVLRRAGQPVAALVAMTAR